MTEKKRSSYAAAGVNIDEMTSSLSAVKRMVRKTATDGVMSGTGSFGGMFASPGKGNVLVASTDGVGTKLKVANMAKRHNTVGRDLVNHCVNDILVQGAHPLFFMDYVGTAKLKGRDFKGIVQGLCTACRNNGCALLGGETAEMPGLYPQGEYDLVGTIVGTVPSKGIITGEAIKAGDIAIGLPSRGLHTNGYSLARHILFKTAGLKINDTFPGSTRSVADVLLDVHLSYLKPVTALMEKTSIHGMAHITGGGLLDNIPRILPQGTSIRIDRNAWKTPNVFQFLQTEGKVDQHEMYRVFNMGIGYVIIVSEKDATQAMDTLAAQKAKPKLIGYIDHGPNQVNFIH